MLLVSVVGIFVWSGTWPGPPGLPETQAGPSAPLPTTSPGGWPRGEIETYDESSLFEKINGKADAYLAYRYEALHFAGYTNPKREDVYVDVYLYVFETPLDAFGMYRSQWAEAKQTVDALDEASTSGGAVFGRRGRHYAEIFPSGPEAGAEALALAKALSTRLPDAGGAVTVPPGLVAEGRKALRFARGSALSVESLRNAFLAHYHDGSQAVVADMGTADAAAKAVAEAVENFELFGSPAVFEAVGSIVIGVVDAPDEARSAALLDGLREGLGSGDGR